MAHDPLTLLLSAWTAMAAWMAGLWLVERVRRNASLADVGWCAGLVVVVTSYAWFATGEAERKILLAVMASVYGLRLGGYILFNRVIGKTEDRRYQRVRLVWRLDEPFRMFGFFQLQAAAVVLFSLPFLAVMQNPRPPFSLWELAGVLIWTIGIAGESLADRQLARFRAKPWNHDRVCRDGLWFFSRHPNYFFEWVHWWAYVAMAVGSPGWLLTWIGPLVMGIALVKITGIPWAEEQALRARGEEYRRYQATTNAFFPWWPKSGHSSSAPFKN
jgi:steroid 5-alpha reductase family enzyme